MAARAQDYHYWANRKKKRLENDNGYISDEDESQKKDSE